jgi:hypothetical protein
MKAKSSTKIINNNIVKAINITNGYYLIVDNILYSVDYNNLAVQSKQDLPEDLNYAELKNKVLSSKFFEQINLYFKDNFKISNIIVDTEQLKVSLSNNSQTANLTYCFNTVEPNAFLSCIASKFEQKTKVKKVVTVESLQDKINKLQGKFNFNKSIIEKNIDNNKPLAEQKDRIKKAESDNLIIDSKIKDIKFKIDFMQQKEQNKKISQLIKEQFNFTHFAIYYLIANLEQEKQAEKPTKNLLPVLYKTEQKTTVKTTNKPLQIEFKKQVLSLPCKQVYLLPMPAAVSLPAEKQKTKDHFADFEAKYLAKVREKKRYRKANSKFAVIFQQIGQFSSVACLIFLFLNSFVMIQKNQNTFQNLAKVETKTKLKQEIAKEPIKTISNLSDNNTSGIIYRLDSKTAKNDTFGSLKWISLVGLFGMIKRKEESIKKKKVYFDSETQCSIRLGDQMVFANGKAGKHFVAECKQIYNSPANGKWYYIFEQI